MYSISETFEVLREVNTVSNGEEFSRFCGRKSSWFSSLVSHGREPSLEALFVLSGNLNEAILDTLIAVEETDDDEEAESYQRGADALRVVFHQVRSEIDQRVVSL